MSIDEAKEWKAFKDWVRKQPCSSVRDLDPENIWLAAKREAAAEIAALKEWQQLAFLAHPNIDLDIEIAIRAEAEKL